MNTQVMLSDIIKNISVIEIPEYPTEKNIRTIKYHFYRYISEDRGSLVTIKIT